MSNIANDPFPSLGRRVALRRLTLADLDRFYAYRSDPDVGRYQGWSAMPLAETAAFLQEMSLVNAFPANEWFQFAVADRATDDIIGDVGICIHVGEHEHAEIGFTFAAAFQGQGFGTETVSMVLELLFEQTSVSHIAAITDARNVACIRLLERVGMTRIETVTALFRGEPCIEHTYKRFRDNCGNPVAPVAARAL